MNISNIFNESRTIFFILLIGAGFSCKKFIEVPPSPDLINSSSVFSNDKTAISAVNGVYVFMRQLSPSLANGSLSFYPGLSADEIYNTASVSEYDQFRNNSVPVLSSVVNDQLWSVAYKVIYRANAILEGIDKSATLTDSLKRQLKGEMKVIRALYYFYLTNLFGDLPLIITSDYQVNASLSRSSSDKIYQQIVTDLEDAKNLLNAAYPSASRAKPNKWTATALLARVYLYKKDWAKAEMQADAIINSGLYNLVGLNNVFLINSNEIIWQITKQNENSNTVDGSTFIPSSSTTLPTFVITDYLFNAFETQDLRKLNWIKSSVVGNNTYYYPYKYKARTNSPVTEYHVIFRLAEQYLIRAEARAQQNNIGGAQGDLNIVRARAGLPNTAAPDKSSLLEAILQERRVELFAEWGHRWFDLKRTGRIDTELSLIKGSNWQSTDALYPIPYNELQYNPFLTQNPGY